MKITLRVFAAAWTNSGAPRSITRLALSTERGETLTNSAALSRDLPASGAGGKFATTDFNSCVTVASYDFLSPPAANWRCFACSSNSDFKRAPIRARCDSFRWRRNSVDFAVDLPFANLQLVKVRNTEKWHLSAPKKPIRVESRQYSFGIETRYGTRPWRRNHDPQSRPNQLYCRRAKPPLFLISEKLHFRGGVKCSRRRSRLSNTAAGRSGIG